MKAIYDKGADGESHKKVEFYQVAYGTSRVNDIAGTEVEDEIVTCQRRQVKCLVAVV